MESTKQDRKGYAEARATYEAAIKEASGSEGTWCISSEKQRVIGHDLLAQTGWTVPELLRAGTADVVVPVAPTTDTRRMGTHLADRARRGGRVTMYPSGPFR